MYFILYSNCKAIGYVLRDISKQSPNPMNYEFYRTGTPLPPAWKFLYPPVIPVTHGQNSMNLNVQCDYTCTCMYIYVHAYYIFQR